MISTKNVIRKLQVSNFGGVLVTLKSSNLLTVAWIKLIFLKIAPFFYINQAYLTIQKGQNIFYGNYWILGQVTEAANPRPDIKGNECETDEVKMYHKIYDIKDGRVK